MINDKLPFEAEYEYELRQLTESNERNSEGDYEILNKHQQCPNCGYYKLICVKEENNRYECDNCNILIEWLENDNN